VTALYEQHYRSLVRLAALLGGGTCPAAEEVVQDSFVALRYARRRRDPEFALLYLRRFVVYRSRSALRRQRLVAGRNRPEPAPGSSAESPAVISALRALPARQREVFILRYYADLSEAQIARVTGISHGGVGRHTARAMAALHQVLDSAVDLHGAAAVPCVFAPPRMNMRSGPFRARQRPKSSARRRQLHEHGGLWGLPAAAIEPGQELSRRVSAECRRWPVLSAERSLPNRNGWLPGRLAGWVGARRLAVYGRDEQQASGPPVVPAYVGWPVPAYIDSMTSAYLAAIGARLSFMVGVISSPPGSQNTGKMANRLICSTRDSLPLAVSTAVATAAGWAAHEASYPVNLLDPSPHLRRWRTRFRCASGTRVRQVVGRSDDQPQVRETFSNETVSVPSALRVK
jgi:RNA polymerase sigma factor (sigma-70 family)